MIGVDTNFLVHFEFNFATSHAGARAAFTRADDDERLLMLTPQVIAEFLHTVTDARRFPHPMPMDVALARTSDWLNAPQVRLAASSEASVRLLLDWMAQHRLGRKRVTDTQLAATFWSLGIRHILTLNGRDFTALAPFDIIDF